MEVFLGQQNMRYGDELGMDKSDFCATIPADQKVPRGRAAYSYPIRFCTVVALYCCKRKISSYTWREGAESSLYCGLLRRVCAEVRAHGMGSWQGTVREVVWQEVSLPRYRLEP